MKNEFPAQIKKNFARERRLKLLKLLKKIVDGQFDSAEPAIDKVFNTQEIPRAEYISSKDRSSYNYGYTSSLDVPGEYF